jgi:RHS repeat-associated protein
MELVIIKNISYSNPNKLEYVKEFVYPNNTYYHYESYNGDFNGDGLSDIIEIPLFDGGIPPGVNILTPSAYLIDLDKRLINNYVKNIGTNIDFKLNLRIIKTGDFNSDGKTDLIFFEGAPANRIYVYSLDSNSNFVKLSETTFAFDPDSTSIGNGNRPNIKLNSDIVVGDFNGDGKSDFAINKAGYLYNPNNRNEKVIFISKGNSFEIEIIPSYWQNYTTKEDNQLLTLDLDQDGKTDLLGYYEQRWNNPYTWNLNNNFVFRYYKRISKNNWVMISKTTNYQNKDIIFLWPILTRNSVINPGYPEIVFQSRTNYNGVPDRLRFFNSFDFFSKKKYLKTITNGIGVKETINYKPLLVEGSDTYTQALVKQNYPFTDLVNSQDFKVVSMLQKQSAGYYKMKLFKYNGAVFNTEGLGFIGFNSILSTNWFDNQDNIISSVTKFDISKRGAVSESFTAVGLRSPTTILSATAGFISKTFNTYNMVNGAYVSPLLGNKVFKLFPSKLKVNDGLYKTSIETDLTYDTYNNPLQTTSTTKNVTITEKVTVSDFDYYNNPTGNPSTPSLLYYIGRPKSKTENITTYDSGTTETISSQQLFQYNNHLLSQVKRRGVDQVFITEDNIFDSWGNLTQKTISAPGLASRITKFDHDIATHRFLTSSKDVEDLETLYTYDISTGQIKSKTLPSNIGYPLVTSYEYDLWGHRILTTDYLGKKETKQYSTNDIYTYSDDNRFGVEYFDFVGRIFEEQVRNMDDLYKTYKFDINDNIIKESEPRFSNGTINYNETKYDIFGRVIQKKAFNGKTLDIKYIGLTTTVNDGTTIKTTTKNALGNVKTSTDEGGTITYNYFANGNLKSTICNGSVTTITQDGWGRKTSLIDPSAGTYLYEYNLFGETTKETVVNKGVTIYDITDVGKLNFKTTADYNAQPNVFRTKTTNTYNGITKLLENIRFDDYTTGIYSIHTYEYDNYKRLYRTNETGFQYFFQRATLYDGFGRPESELYTAIKNNKTSSLWTKNVYKNGYLWKITDNSNNILFQKNTENERQQTLTSEFGNGVKTVNQYDVYGYPTTKKHDKLTNNIIDLTTVFNPPSRGNLSSRTSTFGFSETLGYDTLDRLKDFNNTVGAQTYNANGTISANIIGAYSYTNSNKPFQVSTVTPVDQSTTNPIYVYYSNRRQEINYNLFKSPISISENNVEKLDFEYNAFDSRSTMYYGDFNTDKNLRPLRKFYSGDGSMEIKWDNTTPSNPKLEFITYIGGDAYSAPVIMKNDGIITPSLSSFYYLHRDYQGSILAITNSTGQVVEKRLFDAWGALIQYSNLAGSTTVPTNSNSLFIDRGYTGHEHLLGVALINMNGRIYDPKLHHFLQPDGQVQDPFNTQNFNRYNYALNNPFKYNDPSGESWLNIFGFLFSTYVHGAQASGESNPTKWNLNTLAQGVSGAGAPILSSYASNYATNAFNDAIATKTSKAYYNGLANLVPGSPDYIAYRLSHSPYVSNSNGNISMPTQHHFLGINMTRMSEGNFFEKALYGTANGINIPIQYLMGRGVGDSSMRNLNGTKTTTDEGVLAFGSLPLYFVGGGQTTAAVESAWMGSSTTIGSDIATMSNLSRMVPEEGIHQILLHGTDNGFIIEGAFTSAKDVARSILLSGFTKGTQVRLISCFTGFWDNGAAYQLSRYLKSTVIAPTNEVRVLEGGAYEINKSGVWKIFNPK